MNWTLLVVVLILLNAMEGFSSLYQKQKEQIEILKKILEELKNTENIIKNIRNDINQTASKGV